MKKKKSVWQILFDDKHLGASKSSQHKDLCLKSYAFPIIGLIMQIDQFPKNGTKGG